MCAVECLFRLMIHIFCFLRIVGEWQGLDQGIYYKLARDDPQNENSTEVTELADC